MLTIVLVLASAAYLGTLVVVEAWCVLTDGPTISRRVQGWVRRNVQIALALAAVTGWLLAHLTGFPG